MSFGVLLRRWRALRRLSQLDLALDAEVSTRHLSCVERGHNLVAFELGPMNVQVLGNVAVVQTSVAEKRFEDGKDISGKFVFMDLMEKRAGKWVIVRTLGARVS